jgi:hypothetical protein
MNRNKFSLYLKYVTAPIFAKLMHAQQMFLKISENLHFINI